MVVNPFEKKGFLGPEISPPTYILVSDFVLWLASTTRLFGINDCRLAGAGFDKPME